MRECMYVCLCVRATETGRQTGRLRLTETLLVQLY